MFIGINMGMICSMMGSASVLALFAGGVVGLWFDPNDITTLFQDTAGTTQITAPGQTTALMLDKSKGLALGPELVVNGDFSAGLTGWIIAGSATASVVSGEVQVTNVTNFADRLGQNIVGSASGKTYKVSFDARVSFGTARVSAAQNGASFTTLAYNEFTNTASQRLSFIVTATGGVGINVRIVPYSGNASQIVYVDNISVKELPGYHATQPTAAQRPTYGVIPYGGVRNFAAGSGDVGNTTYWPASLTVNGVVYTKVGSGTDTDGLPYVDISVAGTASSTAFFDVYAFANARISAGIGQTYTTSCLAKLIAGATPPVGCGVVVGVVGETAPATVTENTASTPIAPSVETQTSLTFTFVNAATNQARSSAYLRTGAGLTANYTIRVKALQFEKGSVRTAFQLSMSKYNTTEAGKATVGALFADGIDDGMVTPSIDFSGTDKVTVWAGVEKLSDAAQGMLLELSTNAGATPNSFSLQVPGPGTSFRFVSGGSITAAGIADATGFPAPTVRVLTGIGDISGDRATLQVNGTQVAQSTADQGTGNYSNNPTYLFRRGGTSLPFNGIFTGLIVRGAQSSAAQISNGNTYINSTLGAY
jgi:hypothetical protein